MCRRAGRLAVAPYQCSPPPAFPLPRLPPEQALQFRLREDFKAGGADAAAFERLEEARGLEYELDRVANRAARDKQVERGMGGGQRRWMPVLPARPPACRSPSLTYTHC